MNSFFARTAIALTAFLAAASIACAQNTSPGVQVIDMNATPRPAATKKPAPAHAKKKPAAPIGLPGADALIHNALGYVGTRYVMGGTTPAGFDCSGFTQFAFRSIGIAIPRLADQQFYGGGAIVGDPLPGDLVFFQTYQYGPSHVGIYLGKGTFVSAIGKDVHIDSFESGYFRSRYLGARRYLHS